MVPKRDRRSDAPRRDADSLFHLSYRMDQLEDLPEKLAELSQGQAKLTTQMKLILWIVSALATGASGYIATQF